MFTLRRVIDLSAHAYCCAIPYRVIRSFVRRKRELRQYQFDLSGRCSKIKDVLIVNSYSFRNAISSFCPNGVDVGTSGTVARWEVQVLCPSSQSVWHAYSIGKAEAEVSCQRALTPALDILDCQWQRWGSSHKRYIEVLGSVRGNKCLSRPFFTYLYPLLMKPQNIHSFTSWTWVILTASTLLTEK